MSAQVDAEDNHFYHTITCNIEGWLLEYGARLTQQLLRFQERANQGKPLLEIGIYCGRYFSLMLASAARTQSRVIAVDTFQYRALEIVREHLTTLMPGIIGHAGWHRGPSSDINPALLLKMLGGRPRFVSVDGSHETPDVIHDLKLCDAVLDDDGLVSVDDFINPMTIGVNRGVNAFLETKPNLAAFAYGANKLFLARPKQCDKYRAFVEARLTNDTDYDNARYFRSRLAVSRNMCTQIFHDTTLLLAINEGSAL